VSIDLKGVTFTDALDLLARTNGLFYKVDGSAAVTVGNAVQKRSMNARARTVMD
jgi:hypothetical protein